MGDPDYDADEFGADEVDTGAMTPADADLTVEDDADGVEEIEEGKLTDAQAMEYAERSQFGQTGDMLDTTMGNMGGAGASGAGPDLSAQSAPMPGNHQDLPAGER